MRTMLLAAVTLLGVSTGVTYAGEGGGLSANTQFTQIPGVIAQVPSQTVPNIATAQNRQVQAYATQAGHGTWLFAPQDGGGANN